jgi:hypothetical protein
MHVSRLFLILISALVLCISGLAADTPIMPVSDIRPGMVGTGRTVFNGTRVEEFKAHILGVIENVMGPQRTLILARLEGGPLAETGVIAGMSGSPVYVDGKLIGAVSYSLGNFSKEPIAGITPIEEMTAETALPAVRPAAARVRIDFPLTRESLIAAFRRALDWNRAFAERPGDSLFAGVNVPGLGGSELGTMLRPIATPLVMAGFDSYVADTLSDAFRDHGFIPTGDAVGVTFVNGDLLLGGTGTVTHIDGDRVYAFGHPMYNLGPTEFPMTRAYVYTVLPSLFSSTKLSVTGETIGTLLQDRATAIAGRLGPGPELIPVTLNLEAERGSRRTFRFGVVKDQLFTPLMTYSALLNTLASYERQYGTATYTVQGKALVRNHTPVAFDNLFSGGESPAMGAASYIVAPLTALMANDYEHVNIDGLELTIQSTEEPKTATLQRVWIDDARPRAGRTLPLKVLLRTYRGDDVLRTIPIQIPSHVTGSVSVMVTDGQRLTQAEQREARAQQPRTVPQLLRVLNKVRRNNTLYVRLLGSDAGAVVSGELLSSLPPSVLAVLESDRSGGSFNPLGSTTLGEWELPVDHAVVGVRTLTIPVSPN